MKQLKVLLIGTGAVGIGIAASLCDSGAQVDLVARGATAQAIRAGGLERHGVFKDITVPPDRVRVFGRAQDAGRDYDYVLVSAKTTGNAEIAAALGERRSDILAPGGLLVLLQNGFGNEREFERWFDGKRIYLASFAIGFHRLRPNVSELTVFSKQVLIGSLCGGDKEACASLARAVDRGGIPCGVTDEIGKTVWSKLLYNCALNPLSAILRVNYGGLVASGSGVAIVSRIIDEIFDVMKAAGYATFWPDAAAYKKEFFETILPPTYEHRSSTLQDMERKIPTEIDSLNGAVVRLGERFGVATPCNRMIVELIRAAEALYTVAS